MQPHLSACQTARADAVQHPCITVPAKRSCSKEKKSIMKSDLLVMLRRRNREPTPARAPVEIGKTRSAEKKNPLTGSGCIGVTYKLLNQTSEGERRK
ncbi:hypothetical protein NDU88_003264 [Pleurodeles waltl]|uniref:Uncharacterized protein n=1 Tax=Pleurodeles waltl TaxID=8319 RepID=A0AAV7NGC2_PLEWA|nr:hypothetical protein NDU88_003264 [Pleurodeles waltl]